MSDPYLYCPECNAKQTQTTELGTTGPKDKVAIRCAYCGRKLAEAGLTVVAEDVTLPSER